MNNKKTLFFKSGKTRLVLGAVLMGLVTGYTGYAQPHVDVSINANLFATPDDYVYYPGYNVYYSSHRHEYAYKDGNNWVSRPTPPGVSVDVLRDAPSVKMDFHDSPANHHDEIVKKYPKTWTTDHANHDVKDVHHDEHGDAHHDEHGDDKR